ncbi:hypothetical protein FRACYDRAFT_235882 [Fragilariopsis cylindrus CCMP1102]|uniref:Uncharacterized protein n=1 Tax=Fragilariopsis cylindrus CCMP1102 TaxID=635003 RepID=A0A1E7FNT0_9STRA|nr:hypothetical protein FRACYDRAFT_235882 [Fragilariopsis cylindrus CCMP1102]|eukprot:OEU19821.1 hypothetical protein FRACYDRAFT_235882 [Fragilariopsis cylindrus CCMP1102]
MANANRDNKRDHSERDRNCDQQRSSSLSSVIVPSSSLSVSEQYNLRQKQDYKERLSTYSAKMGNVDNNVDDKNNQKSNNSSRTSGGTAAISIGSSSSSSSSSESVENELVQLLALQSYHLPKNSWMQDWIQYMGNNHPVFGICCHSKIHPIKSCTRVVALVGTFTFGLAMTNLFYVFFLWNPEFNRMLLLWTLGGCIHGMFNLAMWHIAACACCQKGGCLERYACCPNLGSKMIRVSVLCIVFLCIMIVLLRVAINEKEEENNQEQQQYQLEEEYQYINNRGIDILIDDQLDLNVQNISEFTFVLSYLVEMVLALFVYYPIGGTMLFSGILSCGFNIPVLGGRPYEIACEQRRNARRLKRKSTASTATA